MKDNIFKRITDNVKDAFSFKDEDDYYDDYSDDEEEDDLMQEPPAPKPASRPAAPQSAPTVNPQPQFQAAAYQPYGTQSEQSSAPKSKKSNAPIYNMNEAKPVQKLKVALFVLEDMDDARNVADCMIDRGIVTICDMSKISIAEERRVLDFLDGVKYVCNSKIENISEHIYLVVPEAAELSGDFFSQVDSSSFYG